MLADQAGVHSPFAGAAATSNKAPAATIGFQGRRILHSHVCGNFLVKRNDIYDKIPRQAPTRPATDLVRVDGYRHGRNRIPPVAERVDQRDQRSEEHTSELQSLMRISYAVF